MRSLCCTCACAVHSPAGWMWSSTSPLLRPPPQMPVACMHPTQHFAPLPEVVDPSSKPQACQWCMPLALVPAPHPHAAPLAVVSCWCNGQCHASVVDFMLVRWCHAGAQVQQGGGLAAFLGVPSDSQDAGKPFAIAEAPIKCVRLCACPGGEHSGQRPCLLRAAACVVSGGVRAAGSVYGPRKWNPLL